MHTQYLFSYTWNMKIKKEIAKNTRDYTLFPSIYAEMEAES